MKSTIYIIYILQLYNISKIFHLPTFHIIIYNLQFQYLKSTLKSQTQISHLTSNSFIPNIKIQHITNQFQKSSLKLLIIIKNHFTNFNNINQPFTIFQKIFFYFTQITKKNLNKYKYTNKKNNNHNNPNYLIIILLY